MSQRSLLKLFVGWRWQDASDTSSVDLQILISLLGAIEKAGSVALAAKENGVSYRYAWGLLRQWEARLGTPLVSMARGRGTTLASLGAQLVESHRVINARLAPHLTKVERELWQAFPTQPVQPLRLVLHASHDLGVARLAELARTQSLLLDTQYLGSVEALISLQAGRCDVAGFHCPEGKLGQSMWNRYRAQLRIRDYALIRILRRRQGLMIAAGNPKRLQSIRDLQKPGVRVINRQSGSGTRLLLDLLLDAHRLSPESMPGYDTVEYTHAAVAALIASGQADAGIGVEAAARQFGLDFIALAREAYYVALLRRRLREAAIERLITLIQEKEFRRQINLLPGYSARGSGEVIGWTATETFRRGRATKVP